MPLPLMPNPRLQLNRPRLLQTQRQPRLLLNRNKMPLSWLCRRLSPQQRLQSPFCALTSKQSPSAFNWPMNRQRTPSLWRHLQLFNRRTCAQMRPLLSRRRLQATSQSPLLHRLLLPHPRLLIL